jgi:D-apiose dehydrogenase
MKRLCTISTRCVFFGGEFQELYCRLARINPAIAGEDCGIIVARMLAGVDALVDANRISGAGAPELAFGTMRIEGDEGIVRMDAEGNLFLTRYGEPEQRHEFEKPLTGYRGDSVLALQRHAIDCLRRGHPAESEGRTYLKTIEAVEACYRSADTGRPVYTLL